MNIWFAYFFFPYSWRMRKSYILFHIKFCISTAFKKLFLKSNLCICSFHCFIYASRHFFAAISSILIEKLSRQCLFIFYYFKNTHLKTAFIWLSSLYFFNQKKFEPNIDWFLHQELKKTYLNILLTIVFLNAVFE